MHAPQPARTARFAAVALVAASAYPTVGPDPPRWSSDTLGAMAFMHGGDPLAYNVTQLKLIAKFAMAQFDKQCNIASMPSVPYEDRAIAAARAIKHAAPHMKTLMVRPRPSGRHARPPRAAALPSAVVPGGG